MFEADTIDSLIEETMQAITHGKFSNAFAFLGEMKGLCSAYLTETSKWDLIKNDYEAGVAPRKLSVQFKVNVTQIYYRAHYDNWKSPAKIKRAMKPSKKQTFILNCRECEHPFEAHSGHAIICPTCKAYKRKAEGSDRLD